jgi:predicted nucleic acid-binding protein
VRFWDTSSIVPLLVEEAPSRALAAEFERDPLQVVWWGTELECLSALARREREGVLDAPAVRVALDRLGALGGSWREVQPSVRLRRTAARLLRVHPLRAADALQLAAAVIASDDSPRSLPFMTLDDRLALAAEREGFPVVEPS